MRQVSATLLCATQLLLVTLLSCPQTSFGYVYWRNATKRTVGSVVPRPKEIKFTRGFDYLQINSNEFSLHLDASVNKCFSVILAAQRYTDKLLFDDVAPEAKDAQVALSSRKKLGNLRSVELVKPKNQVFKCELMPHANMDETYKLTIDADGTNRAKIEARTNWGFLRALETLSHLIFQLSPDQQDTFGIQPVRVNDEPRFKHRGLMLDTARHFISTQNILLILDAMAYNKLNVLHWHMVDDQSFPFQSGTYPQLSAKSAFRPDMIYRKKDVRAIILYAALQGIRVIPELDTPGHSYPLRHVPDTLSECYDSKTGQKNGDFGPIDPTKPNAYKVVNKLLTELDSVFVDSHFHAGGDEVDFDCWKSSPEIGHWMKAKNMSGNYKELSNYYIRRLHQMLTKEHNKKMLVWQEVFDMGAKLQKENTIIHVWKNISNEPAFMSELARVVNSGYNALLSSCWYLNYIDYGQDWIKFYQCNPRGKPIHPDKAHQVLGGEICMWTEFVDDTNVISRLWPRASPAAERLWSPSDANDTQEFLHRLEQHRCRLLARGIDAEPINGPGYC